MNAGYRLRAPSADELEPVAAVLIADDLDDAGQLVLDEGFLRDQWDREGFDLATDAWVLAPSRGRGIGAALLRHSFAAFAARGVRRLFLAVDAENPTGATVLYERVGMEVVKRWDLWERFQGDPG